MNQQDRRSIETLLGIMATLRDPEKGCPWDREQDFGSIAPHTIEEAYEVADAIDRDDLGELRDELGDLLFQVVFHAQMASELGAFDFGDVVQAISEKMLRRHPHVFGSEQILTADDQRIAWENLKADERAERSDNSALAGIGQALPALSRANKLGKRAARLGFDWPGIEGVIAKMHEELDELSAASRLGEPAAVEEEVGDLLFTAANLARHHRIDPEHALRAANRKFERRFRAVEALLKQTDSDWKGMSPEELDRLWQSVKAVEGGT
ncbi:MAG: nucleoside triphosphate pyrophosphohydrolase [Gammaproteobacteria bacterium]|nr:nucleoside triphosphate pyrophosphohydrolase [Gammaproteobacteria bacterium]